MKEIEGVLLDSSSLWAATRGGVLRYDRAGRRYDRFTRVDGLAGSRILSLAADGDGNLWFGSDGQGLSRYRTAASAFDPPYREFRGLAITSLLSAGNRLFVGTSNGVSLFLVDREEVKETYRLLGEMPKDAAALEMVLLDGALFVGTSRGVAWARLDQPNLQDPESWRSLALGAVGGAVTVGGVLYVATDRGIYAYDPERDTFHPDYDGGVLAAGARGEQAVAVTLEGRMVGRDERADGGGSRRRRSRTSRPSAPRGRRSSGSARAPACESSATPPRSCPANRDRAGSTTWRSPARTSCGPPACPTTATPRPASITSRRAAGRSTTAGSSSPSRPMPKDACGRAAGEAAPGSARRAGSGRRSSPDSTVLRSSSSNNPRFVVVSDIHRDRAGLMWLLNSLVGVAVLDGHPPEREFLFDQKELGLHPGTVLSRLDIGPDGLKWMVSPRSGLALLDDGGTPFAGGDDRMIGLTRADESRLSSDRLFDVLAGRDGRVWLAAENGVNVFTPEYDRAAGTLAMPGWQIYDTADGLPSAVINALEEDDEGNVWVGTEAGLSRINAGGRVDLTFTKRDSELIDDRVKGLRYDGDRGELWIGTLDGLSRLRLTPGDDGPAEISNVYPNPYARTGRQELTFAGLPLGAGLRIYSVSGDLVADLHGEAGRGTITWDGQNDAGYLVASGVYYYVAEGESGESVSGRFALVNGARP